MTNDTTTTMELPLTSYDTFGAMLYIIVVIIWYSIGIVFMLGMEMLARSGEIEDSARRRARFHIRNLREHTNTTEILEELANKPNRDRLWDIYLGTTSDTKGQLTRAEAIRIRKIEKQLTTLKRNHPLTHDTLFSSTNNIPYLRSRSDNRPETSRLSSGAPSTLRRRSSLDEQTLIRWKQLDNNQSKPSEQLP